MNTHELIQGCCPNCKKQQEVKTLVVHCKQCKGIWNIQEFISQKHKKEKRQIAFIKQTKQTPS